MEDDSNDAKQENAFEGAVPVHVSCSKDRVERDVHKSNDNAGPSKFEDLPGAITMHTVASPIGTSISISEPQTRHLITEGDLSNALKMTSVSFSNRKQNLKFKLKGTDLDLAKIMESCLKINNEEADSVKANQKFNLPTVPTIRIQEELSDSTNSHLNGSPRTEAANISEAKLTTNSRLVKKQSSLEHNRKRSSRSSSQLSGLMSNHKDSMSSIGSNVCRICMTRGRERLISPCHCKGSLANVHLSCLERWLNQVGRNHCELCGYSYPAIRTPRYTVLQALRLWFGNPRNRSHLQIFCSHPRVRQRSGDCLGLRMSMGSDDHLSRRSPHLLICHQSDCLIFWLLSTVTAGLLAVCIVGTQYFVLEGSRTGKTHAGVRKEEGVSHRITETAMDFFMAIVLCGYSVTVYLLWKDHYVMWNRWRRSNVNVRLLITPDTNPVPFVPRPQYNVV
ncbi:E3 ubiquitin-protein ligase MARCH2 [Eumeta japonica]|uniref:E3 ubiquitin-protein ligase MARCH2 n=1 Tax=Eumeta variegata TaxID=151549 RepID=A0A4C1VFX6_EUMVA|nr:E3 ubiquitin-protein ligase MARCH2 [Eumeta japonica]